MCFVDEKEMGRIAVTTEDKTLKLYINILVSELCARGWQCNLNQDCEDAESLLYFTKTHTEYLY